ncbi:hypothetical protein GGTG_11309 [Gaeumannomyces tritici R3-111a-1]|uniref:Uncharacterized protein n=1 Tax=Gaeumannomyces tritici (strain R3-111a-1) TaxID=644352 RepID=J3PCU1_GAET3|nr:hypothetical protein GGTG_11309 [Gaeumannomyces tritici R3-111a-1]EJT72061.1 hypothetical protein GGTG_11309 [Gaeumannomyces tritici R3-111a-1]
MARSHQHGPSLASDHHGAADSDAVKVIGQATLGDPWSPACGPLAAKAKHWTRTSEQARRRDAQKPRGGCAVVWAVWWHPCTPPLGGARSSPALSSQRQAKQASASPGLVASPAGHTLLTRPGRVPPTQQRPQTPALPKVSSTFGTLHWHITDDNHAQHTLTPLLETPPSPTLQAHTPPWLAASTQAGLSQLR